MDVQYLEREGQKRLAYVYSPPRGELGDAMPVVVFCGGYRSDMGGTKATWFEQQCRRRSQGYLRFDYSGHGDSEGEFEDGTIGEWSEDTLAVIEELCGAEKGVILLGSSMGGWMVLLAALRGVQRINIRCVIGIAAAPDFTEELFHERLDAAGQAQLMEEGIAYVPNDYSDEPYAFTRAFYEEAKEHLILGDVQSLDCPLKLVQGKQDKDVPWSVAVKIGEVFGLDPAEDIIFIEDGDHSLSRPEDLAMIDAEICQMSGLRV